MSNGSLFHIVVHSLLILPFSTEMVLILLRSHSKLAIHEYNFNTILDIKETKNLSNSSEHPTISKSLFHSGCYINKYPCCAVSFGTVSESFLKYAISIMDS